MKKTQFIILLISISIPFLSMGQNMACFTLNRNRGCAPLSVTPNSSCFTGTAADIRYNYDNIGNPTNFVTTTSHSYVTPGNYQIVQLVNDGIGGFNSKTATVEVLNNQILPSFDADLCAGNRVKLTITDTNYDMYDIDYGDGTVITAAKGSVLGPYTYATNSPKTITVKGWFNLSPDPNCIGLSTSKTITPFASLVAPDIIDLSVTYQAITNGTINVRYTGITNRLYKIEYKIDGIPSPLYDTVTANSASIITETITGLNTQNKTYTVRLQNIDMCGSAPASSAEIASIIIGTTPLNSGPIQIDFSSNGGMGFTAFGLFKNASLTYITNTSPIIDADVTCGTDYSYQIEGALNTMSATTGTTHRSYSAMSNTEAKYVATAPIVTNINSTVEDNHVKVVWDKPTLNPSVPSVDYYTIFRNDNGTYINYGSSNSNSYQDNLANVNTQPYCYEISYKDLCNNVSLISTNTCTVHLSVSRTDETNNLTWTAYTGYQTGIKEYIVENLDENGNVLISKSVGTATSYSETADPTLAQIIYRIKVIPNGTENLISVSNIIRIDLTPQVFMPTVFTPNGDGENDVLEVKGKYYKSVKMTILNKWGEVIFISEQADKGWDGNYKGQPASVDSYAYHIVAFDTKGKEISLKGVVSLLR